MVAYFALDLLHRFVLTEDASQKFEMFCIFCQRFRKSIPVTFLTGFYVSQVVSRYWNKFSVLPYPDKIAMKIVTIGFLTNRAGRNKIPYHAENNSFPSGEAARERIIFQVVRNFISSQAIGQESYSYHFSNRPSSSISQKILKLNNYL